MSKIIARWTTSRKVRRTTATQNIRRRLSYTYALLTGILGLLVLVHLFERQTMPVDLPALLLFTEVALIVSYFKVPVSYQASSTGGTSYIGRTNAEMSLDGAVLLGATLVGGAVFGGWAAFITGLVTSFIPFPAHKSPPVRPKVLGRASKMLAPVPGILGDRAGRSASRTAHVQPKGPGTGWMDSVTTAALNGGRNVIAVATASFVYRGLGGTLAPTFIDTPLAWALIMFCVVYTLVRRLWQWPATVLQSPTPHLAWASMGHPTTLLIELIPLPVALLISATFVELGWSFFLLLSFVFIGFGAVMRQMIRTMGAMREQIYTMHLADQVREAIAATPQEVNELSALTWQLCQSEITNISKFELGLLNSLPVRCDGLPLSAPYGASLAGIALTHVNIQLAVYDDGEPLPPSKLQRMHIPITPLWEWLSQCQSPLLVETEAQLKNLPFPLPPIRRACLDQSKVSQSAMFVPLLTPPQEQAERPRPVPQDAGDWREHLRPHLWDAVDGTTPSAERPPLGATDKVIDTMMDFRRTGEQPVRCDGLPPRRPFGAIVIQSIYPNAFDAQDLAHVVLIAEQIAVTFHSLLSAPCPPAGEGSTFSPKAAHNEPPLTRTQG